MTPDLTAAMLRARHVTDPCLRCHGWGVVMYSSGSTWRGGMGTKKSAPDVCDACWGSGDRYRSGCDLRRLRDEEGQRIARAAVTLLAEAAGAPFSTCGAAVHHIAEMLERLADKRGAPAATHLPEMARALAKTLRGALKGPL
jgi:cytosine/adenosine deaminase-related metal-dependent hydrolase